MPVDRQQAPDVVLDALAAYREGIVRGDHAAVRLSARACLWTREMGLPRVVEVALHDHMGRVVDALSRIPPLEAEALRAIEECRIYWRRVRGGTGTPWTND